METLKRENRKLTWKLRQAEERIEQLELQIEEMRGIDDNARLCTIMYMERLVLSGIPLVFGIAGVLYMRLGWKLVSQPKLFLDAWWLSSWKGLFAIRPLMKNGQVKILGTSRDHYKTEEGAVTALKIKGYAYLALGVPFALVAIGLFVYIWFVY